MFSGKIGSAAGAVGNFATTPFGMPLLGIGLILAAFIVIGAGVAGTLCCLFSPNLMATIGFVLLGVGLIVWPIIPHQMARIVVIILCFVMALISFTAPEWIGLTISGSVG